MEHGRHMRQTVRERTFVLPAPDYLSRLSVAVAAAPKPEGLQRNPKSRGSEPAKICKPPDRSCVDKITPAVRYPTVNPASPNQPLLTVPSTMVALVASGFWRLEYQSSLASGPKSLGLLFLYLFPTTGQSLFLPSNKVWFGPRLLSKLGFVNFQRPRMPHARGKRRVRILVYWQPRGGLGLVTVAWFIIPPFLLFSLLKLASLISCPSPTVAWSFGSGGCE